MREEFEKLPEIATHLAHGNVFYSEEKSAYASEFSALHFVACYVNGAWMAWQEQQKRIDELKQNIAKWQSEVRKAGRDKDMPNDKRKCFMIMANLMDQLVSESLGGDE